MSLSKSIEQANLNCWYNISQICDNLFLSGSEPLKNATQLSHYKIDAIVSFGHDPKCPYEGVLRYVKRGGYSHIYIPIDDSPNADISVYFESVGNKILEWASQGKLVLVHCHAGVSRSVTMVVYVLLKSMNALPITPRYTIHDMLSFVRSKRCVADPNPGFIHQLEKSIGMMK